uniref:Uncharacterized protein n=1 Tax=Glossina morsitans morsitans TaxID=37546 RepID=A0A1B0FJR7_GLOMM
MYFEILVCLPKFLCNEIRRLKTTKQLNSTEWKCRVTPVIESLIAATEKHLLYDEAKNLTEEAKSAYEKIEKKIKEQR